MDKQVNILGAGTYGYVLYELLETLGYEVSGFYDDDDAKLNKKIYDKYVIGKIDLEKLDIKDKKFVLAIGNNVIRKRMSEIIISRGGILPTLIHPKAEISKYAKIGQGCIIHANTYIWTDVQLGDFTIISPHVIIAHHTKIGKACFISAGANVGASINIEDLAFIGIGSTLMTGIKVIGKASVVGSGSNVIRDIPPNSIVAGNPAKHIKFVDGKSFQKG